MTAIAAAHSAQPVPAEQAHSLFRWNAALAGLHGVQFMVMLVLSLAQDPMARWPIVSSYLTFDPATQTLVPAQRTLLELPIGPEVAVFFAMSALAHFAVAFPARGWYERRLARHQNPARWIEYAFSSSVMIVVIAMLTGIREVGTLIAIVGANVAMNLFGWSMEAANEGRARPQWLHYVFGCIAGIVPWLVITVALLTGLTAPGAAPIPGFVIAIYVSLFLSFNVFALNMVFQFRQIGRWRDYLYGERAYMLLSLFAKTLLAWQVWSGTLRP
ncbi:MAG: heliorhodopsin HeR [Chloroflexi bacterium]|nr:heliorhodopsin HeR [Chloroflexota bacterium]